MDKQRKLCLSNDIRNMAGTISRKGHAPLPDWEMKRNQDKCRENFEVLCQLRDIWDELQSSQSDDQRVIQMYAFVYTCWMNNVAIMMRNFVFFDVFELGGRQYDSCFENGPLTEKMMYLLVQECQRNPKLRLAAMEEFGQKSWLDKELQYLCPSLMH